MARYLPIDFTMLAFSSSRLASMNSVICAIAALLRLVKCLYLCKKVSAEGGVDLQSEVLLSVTARVAKVLPVLLSFDIPFSLIGGDECLAGFWL